MSILLPKKCRNKQETISKATRVVRVSHTYRKYTLVTPRIHIRGLQDELRDDLKTKTIQIFEQQFVTLASYYYTIKVRK